MDPLNFECRVGESVDWLPSTPAKPAPTPYAATEGLNCDMESPQTSSILLEMGEAKESGFEFGNFEIRAQVAELSNNAAIGAERGAESEVVSPETVFMVSEKVGDGSNGTNADFAANPGSRWKEELNAKASSLQKRNNKGSDLNEQPRKRMRMKKHRPKIYDETKPIKTSVSKPRKSSKPRKPKPNFTPIPTTPGAVPRHVNKDNNQHVPIEEDVWSCGKISSRRKLDFRTESCIVDHNSTECDGIQNSELKEGALSIPVGIIDQNLEARGGIENKLEVELKNDGLDDIPVDSVTDAAGCCDRDDQNLDINMENKLKVELKNDGLDDIPVDSLIDAADCCDSDDQNLDINMENCSMDQNSKACGEIENKPEAEFKMDKCCAIKVYQRRDRTRSCNLNKKSNASDEIENKSEVDPQLRGENRFNGIKVYQRKFKKGSCIMVQHPNVCDGIKNEPQVGSNFPSILKGKRRKQQKAIVFQKLNAFVGKVLRAQRQKRMKKLMNLYFGEDDLKKKSSNLRAQKESTSVTKKKRETAEYPAFDRCALKWTWITSLKRKRSRRSIRRRNISFSAVVNIKRKSICGRNIPFSVVVNVKRKRSNTSSRRKDCSALVKYISKEKKSNPLLRKASSSRTKEKKDYVMEALVDYATIKMKSLSIDDVCNQLVVQDRIAQGALVTSAEKLGPTKKRKELPKVDLDLETIRVWNLLMESDKSWNLLMENVWSENNEQEDEREKYWREQREIFSGRVESFIARMHLIQGDRRFSQWKGSVVDSVVGVFLTQNVSDHLSSSAFMNIAAKYPPSYVSKEDNSCDEKIQQEQLVNLQSACEGLKIVENYLSSFPSNEVEYGHELEVVQSETEKSKESVGGKQENNINWDELRTKCSHSRSTNRTNDTLDSVNWEAVRKAPVRELAKVIMERGMNNMLAQRIKDFLDRLVKDHGSIDLEWLRDVPQDKAKEYLLSITGLGLKSVECVRLLTLRHHAFPVDTNVARILVRLGWVPLQPLPGDVQIHLLNDYPPMDAIQKYIWPRLCFLTKLILYELHYQMITFGKLFCTKKLPNCNACPMRGECRHFASAYASSKLKLEGPKDKNMATESSAGPYDESSSAYNHKSSSAVSQESSNAPNHESMADKNSQMISEFHDDQPDDPHQCNSTNCEPIIELPASPEPLYTEIVERDIEDFGYASSEEIPTIKLNSEELTNNVKSFLGEEGVSKALTTLNPKISSIPMPKLKYVGRLRTVHHVYVLDDSHPLLAGYEKREADDMCPYLLAIWTSGDLMNSFQDSRQGCNNQSLAPCYSGEIVQFENDKFVRGTILIPCRTANRGSFPLNGTYFQVNEVFADQESSRNPIVIPREWLWNLTRGTLYCGTSATSICRGMSMEEVVYTFWKGFICIRGFDRSNRAPRPLSRRFHLCKTRKVDDDDV